MVKKILERITLVILNLIGIYMGIVLGLTWAQDVSGTQDNHFLGGIFSLIEMVVLMVLGIVTGMGSTLLITAAYIVLRNKNKL